MLIVNLSGIMLLVFTFWVLFYALLIRASFSDGGSDLEFREALWLSLTGVLLTLKIVKRPKPEHEGLATASQKRAGTKAGNGKAPMARITTEKTEKPEKLEKASKAGVTAA